MHNAPSVSYPVGRFQLAAGLLLGIWLLGAACVVLWSMQMRPSRWQLAASALLLLCAGLCAGWNWWRTPRGVLSWDGESWSWPAVGQAIAGAPHVSLDLQHWLLLRWSSGDGPRWLWLERVASAERWGDLRRAVYSRARPQALPPDQSAAAKP